MKTRAKRALSIGAIILAAAAILVLGFQSQQPTQMPGDTVCVSIRDQHGQYHQRNVRVAQELPRNTTRFVFVWPERELYVFGDKLWRPVTHSDYKWTEGPCNHV